MGNYNCYGPVNPVKLPASGSLPERECYDFYKDCTSRKSIDDKEIFLQDALINQDQLFLWAQLAYQIFKSEEKSYWDHRGKGWDSDFGNGGYIDMIDYLCKKHDKKDGAASTGLMLASSLDEVEKAAGMMAQTLNGKKIKAENFIKQCPLEPFHEKKDSQTVFYSIAGICDRYGKTYQYGYTVLGLAFFNFQLKVVADGTRYNTAIGNRTIEQAVKEGNIPGFKCQSSLSGEPILYPVVNRNSTESSQTVDMTIEYSNSETNSISNAKEYSFSEMIGASIELNDILNISKIAMEMQFTAGQVIRTAYTDEKSVSSSKSHSSSTTVTLPPHTEVVLKQQESNTVTTLKYDCPVMVQFDVAVFSMCGTYYDDNAAVRSFSTSGYDQRSFITLFQPSASGSAGEDGSENLYLRSKNYSVVGGYDKMHGVTQLKSRKSGLLKDTLDWKTILKQTKAATAYQRTNESSAAATLDPDALILKLAAKRPMSPTGAVLTEAGTGIVSTIEDPVPLYALSKLKQDAGSDHYDVGIDDSLYPNNWTVLGYNAKNVPFYGFDTTKGHWILVDENGSELKDDSLACINYEPLTKEPYIQGKKKGVVYAKYLIPEPYYTCKDGSEITNESIQTVFVKITIHSSQLDGSINAADTINVKNETTTNLELLNALNVHVYDETGTEIIVPVIWETSETQGNGIKIANNQLTASATGTYQIRAKYENLVSDWITVQVTNP